MPGTEKHRRLQSRLLARPDRADTGQLLPLTAQALRNDDPYSALAGALLTERVLLAVGKPVQVSERDVYAFTSTEAMTRWDSQARPVPMSGPDAAMLAVALNRPRLLIDNTWTLIRPAVEALAAGDQWVPPWEDQALKSDLGSNARILVGADPLVIEIIAETREQAEAEIGRLSRLPRLGVAAERVEFRPRPADAR